MRNLDSSITRMEALAELEASDQHDNMAYQVGMQEMIEELGGANGLMGQYSYETLSWKPIMKWGILFWVLAFFSLIAWWTNDWTNSYTAAACSKLIRK